MAKQFFDLVVYYIPGYAIILMAMLLPAALMVILWRATGFFGDRAGDRFIRTRQLKRRFERMGDDKTREELLHSLRTLDPREYEYYVASMFANEGFDTKVVGGHGEGDGGIDIVMERQGSKYFVQCKKLIGRGIGVKDVRDFYGAIADQIHDDPKSVGYFATTTFFTDEARAFAKGKRLRLHDGDSLVDIIFRQEGLGDRVGLAGRDRSVLLRNVPPICPVCRRSLAWRKKDQSVFIGCTGYPQCHYIFSLKEG